MTTEPTEEEALIMAEQCPLIRAAYATGDDEAVRRMEAFHPPSRCEYAKQAAGTVPD